MNQDQGKQGGKGKGGIGKAAQEKAKKVTKSQKAGLKFPVGKIARLCKAGRYSDRIGVGAPVYLAAVLEYFTAEIMELAAQSAKDC